MIADLARRWVKSARLVVCLRLLSSFFSSGSFFSGSFSSFFGAFFSSFFSGSFSSFFNYFNSFFSYGSFFSLGFVVTASYEGGSSCYSEHEDVLFHFLK